MEETTKGARQMMADLLQKMGIETEIEAHIEEGILNIEIMSDERGILIGKHGRTIESMQILMNRMVHKQFKNSVRINIDVGGYKKNRSDFIKKMANRIGESVKKTGKGVSIGPFNAQERRIIHITFKEDPSIKTGSTGEGEWKKIKIFPSKKQVTNLLVFNHTQDNEN